MTLHAGDTGYWAGQAYRLGEKLASDASPSYSLRGLLHTTRGGGDQGADKVWGLLSVPNALVRGVFDAMDENGVELPLSGPEGRLNAHITVLRPDEIAMCGGPEAFTKDRGRAFRYTLGRLVEFDPAGWPEMSRCWAIRCHSPELQQMRRSYGLSGLPDNGKYDFHITVAVRRRGVLGRNDKAKAPASSSARAG